MDRIDAMKVFVAALDEGSLAGAGRKLGKSAAAVSRAIASLEAHVGVELLHRTTRSLRLSDAGERYAIACRRVLAELDEADSAAAGARLAPQGLLTITAAVSAGEVILAPIIDAFTEQYPAVSVRLLLLDRLAHLIDEGIDLALRIAHLPDSTLIAVRLGQVRRVVVASPRYLETNPAIGTPADLAQHQIVAMTQFGTDGWTFPPTKGSSVPRIVRLQPRLVVNSVRAAVGSVVAGHGLTRIYSYHITEELRGGSLKIVLSDDEGPPLPIHLITPQGRLQAPKVRAFIDFAVPRLKVHFASRRLDAPSSDQRSWQTTPIG